MLAPPMDLTSIILLAVFSAAALLNLAQLLFYFINRSVLRRTGRRAEVGAWPSVDVCIPARDEAANIERCVRSLMAQDYAGEFRITVLDDESSDGTADIVRRLAAQDARVRLMDGRAEPLPSGWVGKVWANTRLGRAAQGQWLLFVDADTFFDSNMLREALACAHQAADPPVGLFSGYLRFEQQGLWEGALMASFFASQHMLPLPLALGRKAGGPAPGHWHLFRRETYERLGGYAKVWDKVLDDMETSALVNRAGLATRLLPLERWGAVRMYRSFGEIWWGVQKSIGYTLQRSWLNALCLVLLMLVSGVAPFFAPFLAAWRGFSAPETLPGLTSLCAILLWRWLIQRDQTGPWWGWLSHPLMAIFLAANGIHGVAALKFGIGVVWKGRRYDGKRPPAAPNEASRANGTE